MEPTTARLRYHGTGGSLFGLMIVNFLLTVITLGFYSFWARNKLREFHYSHTEMEGDRFAYHGTGGELLSGWIKAFGVFFVLALAFALASIATGGETASLTTQFMISAAFYLLFFLLMPIAINGARRYRLSRSSWRGIRFSFHGRWQDYLALVIRGTLLSILTLSFYRPVFQNQRRAFFVDHARFGSEPFIYDGDGRALVWEYVKAVLLTLPTLGLYWVWYAAFKHRYFWGHTMMGGARLRSSVTGGGLLGLYLTNALLAIFTLGVAAPWIIARTHAYWCDNIYLRGAVDWATIQQNAQTATATAEGLAEVFDVDLGFAG